MLRACHTCSCLYRATDGACPHCGSSGATKRSSRAVLLLSLTLGVNGGCEAMYGVVKTIDSSDPVDADGDGWFSDEDCDDGNPDVHPEATETAGDEEDSNCDGEDDT